MDISGNYTLNAPREQVWNALLDPDLLKRSIPGCESLEQTGENQYAVRLRIAVAGVKGVYQGTLRMLDAQQPESYRVVVDGAGARGIVHSEGVLRLEANAAGTTDIHYTGQAQLGGALASMGAQVAQGAGNMLVREYLSRMADLLPSMPAPATPAPEPSVAAVSAEPPAAAPPAAPMEAFSTPAPAPVDAFMPPPTAPIHTSHPPAEHIAPLAPIVGATDAASVSTPKASDARPLRLGDGGVESQRRAAGIIGAIIIIVAVVIVIVVVLIVTGR